MKYLSALPEAAVWALIGLGGVCVFALIVALLYGVGMVVWDVIWDLGGTWADLKRRIFPTQRNH